MSREDSLNKDDARFIARGLRLAVVQNQYSNGNLTEAEALELLAGPLTPGDDTTIVDDSDCLDPQLYVPTAGRGDTTEPS